MQIKPDHKQSAINFKSFMWHSAFLALASNFMDVDTVIPSMLIKSGGSSLHLGLLTAIMLGGSSLFQLLFANYLSDKQYKKKFLLLGINLRVMALILMASLFFLSSAFPGYVVIILIFLFISLFSFSGSFANVSYIDILGKSVLETERKKFFSLKQVVNSSGVMVSVLLVRQLLKKVDYPFNYATLFIIAAFLLFIASLGFWQIKEVPSLIREKTSFLNFFKLVPVEIRKNKNLFHYLIIINSMGPALIILPFVILFAKKNFGLSYALIGNFLLLRTVGTLAAGLFLFKYARKFSYKALLTAALFAGASIPLFSLAFAGNVVFYQMLFIISGMFVAVYKVSVNGILLEISDNQTYSLYAGISGAGNIVTTVFPLFAGFLIALLGYHIVFTAIAVIVLSGFFSVRRLNCKAAR